MTGTLNSVLFPTAPNSRHLGNERLFNLTPLSNLSAEDRRKFVLFGRGPQDSPHSAPYIGHLNTMSPHGHMRLPPCTVAVQFPIAI